MPPVMQRRRNWLAIASGWNFDSYSSPFNEPAQSARVVRKKPFNLWFLESYKVDVYHYLGINSIPTFASPDPNQGLRGDEMIECAFLHGLLNHARVIACRTPSRQLGSIVIDERFRCDDHLNFRSATYAHGRTRNTISYGLIILDDNCVILTLNEYPLHIRGCCR